MRFDLGCRPLRGQPRPQREQQQPPTPVQRGVNNIRVMTRNPELKTTLTALGANVATGQESRDRNNFIFKRYQQAPGLFVEIKDPFWLTIRKSILWRGLPRDHPRSQSLSRPPRAPRAPLATAKRLFPWLRRWLRTKTKSKRPKEEPPRQTFQA